ncbi:hypothetical protein NUU61_010132 [Penicillium alfredii]|uniref:Uncharacterized protein n=1 Tax=Penicillium alfredii TaxID=1506179 RepID=A0A9W9JU89_9EURO|nr:uncharacterized protein NUU61_010132 [Penicillium alfredii]KAJ5081868.1 hypothetical protein NUU61_010132 [Penicillium alfredii]
MSDTDQEWKPSGRPQSTMAQAFSTALDSAFMLDSDVNNLSLSIDQKKQQMMIQSRELEALQERIRETESRLKKNRQSVSIGANPSFQGERGQASRSAAPQGESADNQQKGNEP